MFFENHMPFLTAYPGLYSWEQEQHQEREARLLKSLYPETASKAQRLVERECDRMEYDGSMMYDEYPDKFMMEHICQRIEDEMMDEDVRIQERKDSGLSELIRVLFFNEMYRRRCRHHRCRRYF